MGTGDVDFEMAFESKLMAGDLDLYSVEAVIVAILAGFRGAGPPLP